MSKRRRSNHLTQRERDRLFRPFAVELGKLLYAWNHLHEQLARLFRYTSGISNAAIATAIWHSTPSDLAQRKMLRAAGEQRFAHESSKQKDMKWLLDKIDHTLARNRNDAIHAPLAFFIDEVSSRIEPYTEGGNPRAESLRGTPASSSEDILKKIIWYCEYCDALRQYAGQMTKFLVGPLGPRVPQPTWPDKPTLPSLGAQKIAKKTLRAMRGKGHQLRVRLLPKTVGGLHVRRGTDIE